DQKIILGFIEDQNCSARSVIDSKRDLFNTRVAILIIAGKSGHLKHATRSNVSPALIRIYVIPKNSSATRRRYCKFDYRTALTTSRTIVAYLPKSLKSALFVFYFDKLRPK